VREGSAAAGAEPHANAEARARAREDTPPPPPIAFQAVTESARAARRLLASWQASGAAALDRQGSLADAQPPTFRQARDRHHECAGHLGTWAFLRVLRLAWGYFHLLVIKPALNAAEWVTETPARFFITCAVAAVIWIWS
jgi:hypothetical protein